MKKWLKFFCLSFFSDKISREGAKRGYTNFFVGLILALVFLWTGFVGGDMLPFGVHYNNSTDFKNTVHSVFANADVDKRIDIEIRDGALMAKKHGGEYADGLVVNTFENDADRQNYSANGYNVIIDTRPADALAEVEVYGVSNDGKGLTITYEEYLSLSTVARLNFDVMLTYTGRELVLTDAMVEDYKAYVELLNEESKLATEKLANSLSSNEITKSEYNRAIYELYFTNYFPDITSYETTSKVPLLRNFYYHKYIKEGINNYLFVFDDSMAGSFETDGGIVFSFYGFYGDVREGALLRDGINGAEANATVDEFIKSAYDSISPLIVYAYAMNVFSLIPFIALMPLVVTLLAYSILRLRGVESVTSFGAMFRILGSYVWFSGMLSAVLSVIIAFFVQKNIITVLPLILFFVTLAVRSIIFAIRETVSYKERSEEQEALQEV